VHGIGSEPRVEIGGFARVAHAVKPTSAFGSRQYD
jgi:hypothetical protein